MDKEIRANYRVTFSDPNGRNKTIRDEIYAESDDDAYSKAYKMPYAIKNIDVSVERIFNNTGKEDKKHE